MRTILAAVSMMAIIPPALAQESANWWNPALDAKFRFAEGEVPDPKPELSRDALTVWQFVLGTSGSFADGYMPFWQAYALAENCAAGSQAMNEVSNEFGDHAKANAAFAAARSRFKAWAASQTQTLSMYGDATLGSWTADTSQIQVANYPLDWSTLRQPYGLPLRGKPLSTQGRLHDIHVQFGNALCPKPGGWSWMPTQMSLGMSFYTERNGALTEDFPLPKSFALPREAAQAFVSRTPDRKVRLEIQITPLARGDRLMGAQTVFSKAVTIKRMIVRDAAGTQLADIAF